MNARRKFWGWGMEGQGLSAEQRDVLLRAVAERYGVAELGEVAPPEVEDFDLPKPRISPPASLGALVTAEPYERLLHACGRSFADVVRLFRRQLPHLPDQVAYPRSENDLAAVLDWVADRGAAAVPFGGGSSVVGGVEPAVGDGYAAAVSIDMKHFDRLLEVDRMSRAARMQAGVFGPDLEAQLRVHGYTLRHFPQSFEHSTLGGWIATRSAGHYATLYTHIDDFVESIRMLTPRGILESRRLPGSGAGPSPDRLMIGSEGTLGVITEAWLRVQDLPKHRASAAIAFAGLETGAEAVRALSQSALFPANCRLIDGAEARATAAGDGRSALLVLGFESGDHPVDGAFARALELVRDHGGRRVDEEGHRGGASGRWRDAFLRAPYFREVLAPAGVISDTFETAITWDRFAELHGVIRQEVPALIERVTGTPGTVTCRFTHVYPDGPAPYFTFQGLSHLDRSLEEWREIKAGCNELVVRLGGTVTHHHAVGRDHRPGGYDVQRPALFAEAFAAVKKALDPGGVMNPGVLIDPAGREVGVVGAMGR